MKVFKAPSKMLQIYYLKQIYFHYSLEYGDVPSAMPADADPNVEPQRVLWPSFCLGWLANFPITSAAELLEGN